MKYILSLITLSLLLGGCSLNVYKSVPTKTENSEFGKSYNLPVGRILILVERKEENKEIEVTVSSKVVADQNNKFLLKYDRNYLFEDSLVTETDASGLLVSINTLTVDKTAAIVEQVGALAGESLKIAALETKTCTPTVTGSEPFIKQYEINPDDAVSITNMKSKLHTDHCIDVDLSDIQKNIPVNIPSTGEEGIYYRDLKEFSVTIDSGFTNKTLKLYLPDRTSINKISVDRSLFVERKVDLTFTSGTLTKIDAKYPSEVLGFVSLPLALVKGVSGAVLGQFGLKIDTLKNQTSLATEELNLLKAKAALQKGN